MADFLPKAIGNTAAGFGVAGPAGAGVALAASVIAYLWESGQEDKAAEIERLAQENAGRLTDEAIQSMLGDVLGPTALASIQQDPRFESIQNETLAELGRVADSGGMTIEAQGQFSDALSDSHQRASQDRQAALQGLRSRGLNSAGAEVQLLAAGGQQQANADARTGRGVVADAQGRALDAIRQRGDMAGRMQGADWGRQSQKASAQDHINQLNWGNRRDAYAMQAQQAQRGVGYAQRAADQQRRQGEQAATMIENTGENVGGFVASGAAGGAYDGIKGWAQEQHDASLPVYAPNYGGGFKPPPTANSGAGYETLDANREDD